MADRPGEYRLRGPVVTPGQPAPRERPPPPSSRSHTPAALVASVPPRHDSGPAITVSKGGWRGTVSIVAVTSLLTAALQFGAQRAAPAPTIADRELAEIRAELRAARDRDERLQWQLDQWQRGIERDRDALTTRVSALEAARMYYSPAPPRP